MDTPCIDAMVTALRLNGYVVIPKDRVKRLTISESVSHAVLEHYLNVPDRFEHYRVSKMGRALGYDLIAGPCVLWTERDEEHHKIFTAEMRVIIPKPEEPADG